MKTAMQEMIDYFEKQISEYPEDCQKGHIPRDVLNGMHHSNCNALAMAKKLLEKDKIEMPSDEDLEKAQKEQRLTMEEMCRFEEGVEWMIKQINNQK